MLRWTMVEWLPRNILDGKKTTFIKLELQDILKNYGFDNYRSWN